jgi:hypothetical protein
MAGLTNEIRGFLASQGFESSIQVRDGLEVIATYALISKDARTILPLRIDAESPEEAAARSSTAYAVVEALSVGNGYPLIITEDRWNNQRDMMQQRILAHMEAFIPVYARNCEIRRIDKGTAAEFLNRTHSYGDASCRYRYGLFLKRYTGARKIQPGKGPQPGELVAVATFSNARRWNKEGKVIRSHEWTRYASLPGVRINGGMGKFLKEFIKDANPDDIMTYADLEWSEGDVYRQLGFSLEGRKSPVVFHIDPQWNRHPVHNEKALPEHHCGDERQLRHDNLFYQNFGSNKFRLKLTEYR